MSLASLFAQHVSNASTDTTSPQPNHTVTPTHIEPEQYTHTQWQTPADERTSIRNMLSKKWSKWHQLVYLYSTIKKMHGPINIRFTYINIQFFFQTQQNFIMFIIVLGRHVSILTESSSGPKKIDP